MIERISLKDKIKEGGNYFSSPKTDIKFISSGSKLLDMALGGGWAENRVGNIVGDKSTGKTGLAIELTANFARKYSDSPIYYRETEAAFLPDYASALGMPLDRIDFGNDKPIETIEDMFDDLNDCAKATKRIPTLYICDSLDALSDEAEMGRGFGEGSYGTQKAKDISKLFRQLMRQISNSNITLIIVSQIRSKIGVTFGEKTTRSGGRALDFYAAQVVYLSQTGTVSQTISGIKRITGIEVRARVKKNKIGLPFREANFTIMFGQGVNDIMACLEWLKEARSLNELDISDPKTYIKTLNRMNDDDYYNAVSRIYKATEENWWRIEKSFLPTRKKIYVD